MRILPRHSLFAVCCLAALGASAMAQEPEPSPTPAPSPTEPAEPEAPTPPPEDQPAPRPRPRRQAIVIEAGTVHPVAGPAIENGVVLIRGERIAAVGKQGEVEVPPNAIVRSFPTGHVYPGLVDASTDAFTDAALRNDGSLDGGAALADDLHLRMDREDLLAAAGITTAYVTVRSPALLRGQGAIVRPTGQGFEPWSGRERAAVQLRLTNGPTPTHALQRQQQQQQADALFEGLDDYKKARTDHEEALKKYQKEFDEYIAWHQKKKDAEKPADKGDKKDEPKPATPPTDGAAPAAPPEGRRGRGNRGGGGGGGEPPKDPPRQAGEAPSAADLEAALTTLLGALAQDPPKQDPPKQEPKPAPQVPPPGAQAAERTAGDKGDKKDEAPKRPTYPKAPVRDPQKEALLRVVDGELPLRVEAHRADEVRAALRLQAQRSIPVLVLEQAYGAAPLAAELADKGVAVVLTEVLPEAMPRIYEDFDPVSLPARLQAAGVSFAIATGSGRRASLLPIMAAAAVGRGLDRDAALRAITLTPAEILGVAKDTGSLQSGKLADVMVCDGPLFASDSRVLFVLAKGRTEYEAK